MGRRQQSQEIQGWDYMRNMQSKGSWSWSTCSPRRRPPGSTPATPTMWKGLDERDAWKVTSDFACTWLPIGLEKSFLLLSLYKLLKRCLALKTCSAGIVT